MNFETLLMYKTLWPYTPNDQLEVIHNIAFASSYQTAEGIIPLSMQIMNKIYEATHISFKASPLTLDDTDEYITALTRETLSELGVVLSTEQIALEAESMLSTEISNYFIQKIGETQATTLISGPFMSKIYTTDRKRNEKMVHGVVCTKLLYKLTKD